MLKKNKNRDLIISMIRDISGQKKTKKLLRSYTNDNLLVSEFLFYEKIVPKFQIIPDEITTESDRVILCARIIGRHTGEVNKLSATNHNIESQVIIGFHISRGKISNHWFVTDKIELMKQLGISLIIG